MLVAGIRTFILISADLLREKCLLLNSCAGNLVVPKMCLYSGSEAMTGVARCRKRAQEILAQAERNPRHSRKLIAAAECWLEDASCLRRVEKSLEYLRRAAKETTSFGDLSHADRR